MSLLRNIKTNNDSNDDDNDDWDECRLNFKLFNKIQLKRWTRIDRDSKENLTLTKLIQSNEVCCIC